MGATYGLVIADPFIDGGDSIPHSQRGADYATTLSFDASSSSDMVPALADALATSGLMAVFTIGLSAVFSCALPVKPRTV